MKLIHDIVIVIIIHVKKIFFTILYFRKDKTQNSTKPKQKKTKGKKKKKK